MDANSPVPAIPAGTPDAKIADILGQAGENFLGSQFGNAGPDPDCRVLHSSVKGLRAEFSAVCTQGSRRKTLHMILTMSSDGRSGQLIDQSTDATYPHVELHRIRDLPPSSGGFYPNGCGADLLE